MRFKQGIWCLGAALLCALPACAGLLNVGGDGGIYWEAEPPQLWASAVNFHFRGTGTAPEPEYTTRIEFHDGIRGRVVTGGDIFRTPGNFLRTPWYRLRVQPTTIRVILEHPGGDSTIAEYPLAVERDEFYYVSILVYKHEPAPPHMPDLSRDPRAYPLHPSARAQPGDSLWISYNTRGRYCFDCPR